MIQKRSNRSVKSQSGSLLEARIVSGLRYMRKEAKQRHADRKSVAEGEGNDSTRDVNPIKVVVSSNEEWADLFGNLGEKGD